jgi:rhodanese-related sulfurtransferase
MEGLAHGIKASELNAKMKREEDFLLLDVRSKQEVEEYPFIDHRIVNIPLDELRSRLDEIGEHKEIITLCRTSVRAYEAERILRGAGFKDVKFLDGSIAAWPY